MNTPMICTLAQDVIVPANDEITSGFSYAPVYNRPTGIVGLEVSIEWLGQNPTPGDITISLALALSLDGYAEPLTDVVISPPTTKKIIALDTRHANYLIVKKIANASTTNNAKVSIRSTL
ncbi:MAG: hypothetical protein QXQ53_05710 [Candidatus Methanosuratincola sp.]